MRVCHFEDDRENQMGMNFDLMSQGIDHSWYTFGAMGSSFVPFHQRKENDFFAHGETYLTCPKSLTKAGPEIIYIIVRVNYN